MGALPKRKYAKARQGERRSHLAWKIPGIDICPKCHSPRLSHRVCRTCGSYNGREVITIKARKGKTD